METFKTIDECFYLIQNGANIKQGQINGGYPITRIETISNDKFNRDKVGYAGIFELGKYASYVLEDGDLLMSHINSPQYLGRTVLYKKKDSEIIIHGMNLLRLKANVEIINPGFARYLFYSVPFRRQIAKITKKSVNQASFSINDLKKVSIVIPSLSVQEKIVKKLNSAISVRNYYERQIELLDELVKARFVEMFGDPIENTYSFPILKLGELSELITKGASPSWQGYSYTSDSTQTLFVTSENVREGYMDFSSIKYVEDAFNEKQKRSMIQKGDYLINIVGASIGRAAQFNMDCKANMNQAAALVRIKDNTISDNYLLYYLNSDKAQMMYNSMKSDTGRANLSLQDIANLEILVPDLTLQVKFASFVEEIDKSRLRELLVIKHIKLLLSDSWLIFY